jgi:hypothetical protein
MRASPEATHRRGRIGTDRGCSSESPPWHIPEQDEWCELCHANGRLNYCILLEIGYAIPIDKSLAAHSYKLSADQGLAAAQFNYGMILKNGYGIPIDRSRLTRMDGRNEQFICDTIIFLRALNPKPLSKKQ